MDKTPGATLPGSAPGSRRRTSFRRHSTASTPFDREVLALRHFEPLGRDEAAQVLGITQEAGAKRYFRALKRLKDALATRPGGLEGL